MMNQRSRKGGKLLASSFSTYFIVLIIPILLAVLFYQEALHIVQRDIEYENQALLNQASEILDARVEELHNIGTQLISSAQVQTLRYISEPLEYPNTTKIISARNNMTQYAAYNDMVFDYLLYFNTGQFVMNDRSIYSYRDYFDLYMHPVGQTYEEWLEETLNASPAFGVCRAQTVEFIQGNTDAPKTLNLVTFSYSYYPYDNKDGHAVLYVKQSALLDMISHMDTAEGSVFVENSEGQLIASRVGEGLDIAQLQDALHTIQGGSASAQCEISGQDMVITQATSAATGLRIAIALSKETVFARLNSLRSIIIWTMFLAILLGGSLSYYLSSRGMRYMRNIARDSGENLMNMSYNKALRSLQMSFANIHTANESMHEILAKQKVYLQYTYLSRLIDGDFRSEEDAATMATTIGACAQKCKRCVVLFRLYSGISAGNAMTLQKSANCMAIINMGIKALESQSFYTNRSEEEVVLLLEGENLRVRIEALVHHIRAELPQDLNEMLYVYVGNSVELLTEVVRSYGNAASLIYIKPPHEESPAIFYDATENPKYVLFYPQDMQHHLIDCTMIGDEAGVQNLLTLLKERNFTEANLPKYMQQIFINNLLNTLLQVTTLSGLPFNETEMICERIKDLMGLSLCVQILQIDQLFLLLCQAVQRQKSDKQQNMIEGVMAYINSSYADCELSLAHVAQRFAVSESYLSYVFKIQSGTNFFNYVEGIRMEKAKELLKQTNLKVGEIAVQIGYTSANSFCRAFKRNTGDNASTYRNGVESSES